MMNSDPWSTDREVIRVNARLREENAAVIDSRYTDDDYRSALQRALRIENEWR